MTLNINVEKRIDHKNEIIIYKKIIHAIDIHREAIELVFKYCLRTLQHNI